MEGEDREGVEEEREGVLGGGGGGESPLVVSLSVRR